MTLSTIQEFPNRVNESGNKAVVGSTTGVDANDPTVADHDGTHYFYQPGGAGTDGFTFEDCALPAITDLDLRLQVSLPSLSPTTTTRLWKGESGATERVMVAYIHSGGGLQMAVSEDGSTWGAFTISTATLNTAGMVVDTTTWLRWVFTANDGGGNKAWDFYFTTDADDTTATWTPVGTQVTQAGVYTGVHQPPATDNVDVCTDTTVDEILVYKAKLLNGIDGTTVLETNLATDIDTSSDPDAGQTGWTATSGHTVTVTRASSGLVGAVVTRPVALLDGTANYLQLPAEDTPTFTKTAGKHTVVVAFRRPYTGAGTDKIWSSESAADNGAYLDLAGTTITARAGDGTAVSAPCGTVTVGALEVAALVVNEGDLHGYHYGTGLSIATAMSAIAGTITHEATPRWGSRAYSAGTLYEGEVFEHLTFHNQALTEDQLDSLAATLISGDYT